MRLKYFEDEDVVKNFHKILSEYFLGTWSKSVAKPYKFTQQQRAKFGIKEREGLADRKVAAQPLVYLDKEGHLSRFNLRKFSELPYHLIRAKKFEDLFREVLFNYSWLHAKLSSCPLEMVVADFQAAYESLEDAELRRQVLMVQDTLKLGGGILAKIPDMLAGQIIGRLLPEIWNYPHIEKLIRECDELSPPSTLAETFRHACLQSRFHQISPFPGQNRVNRGCRGNSPNNFFIGFLIFLLLRSPCKIPKL